MKFKYLAKSWETIIIDCNDLTDEELNYLRDNCDKWVLIPNN